MRHISSWPEGPVCTGIKILLVGSSSIFAGKKRGCGLFTLQYLLLLLVKFRMVSQVKHIHLRVDMHVFIRI